MFYIYLGKLFYLPNPKTMKKLKEDQKTLKETEKRNCIKYLIFLFLVYGCHTWILTTRTSLKIMTTR